MFPSQTTYFSDHCVIPLQLGRWRSFRSFISWTVRLCWSRKNIWRWTYHYQRYFEYIQVLANLEILFRTKSAIIRINHCPWCKLFHVWRNWKINSRCSLCCQARIWIQVSRLRRWLCRSCSFHFLGKLRRQVNSNIEFLIVTALIQHEQPRTIGCCKIRTMSPSHSKNISHQCCIGRCRFSFKGLFIYFLLLLFWDLSDDVTESIFEQSYFANGLWDR